MTDEQRKSITDLRHNGYGYTAIAKAVAFFQKSEKSHFGYAPVRKGGGVCTFFLLVGGSYMTDGQKVQITFFRIISAFVPLEE